MMNAPISIEEICTALQNASEMLAAPDREQVLTLLASTSPASRALCLFSIEAHAPVEVWGDAIYAPHPDEKTPLEQAFAEALLSVGWLCFLLPNTFNAQFGTLSDLVDAFHFFAPLRPEVLGRLEASLAQKIRALQRLRPAIGSELYGDELTFVPPAAFGAVKPDLIAVDAMSPLDSPPRGRRRYPFEPLSRTRATLLILHGPATRIEPDPAMGLSRTR